MSTNYENFAKITGLVEPIEIELGRSESGKKETYCYVPILLLLQQLMQNEDIYNSINKWDHESFSQQSDPDKLSDFCHGSVYNDHDSQRKHGRFLRLHLYSDEFEVVNVLGSKRTKHKVCAFYFYIGNMEPKHRSQLQNIYLCILVRHKLLQGRYSYNQLLQRFLADLSSLYHEGIVVELSGSIPFRLFGYLATISADNLSAHSMAGFSACFSSGHICRSCTATYTSMRMQFEEAAFLMRTKHVHANHCNAWKMNAAIATKAYGVTNISAFTRLEYLDITEAFPHDIMHDFLEGVIPIVLTCVIKHLHVSGTVTINDLNRKLEEFSFGKNDRSSKPVAVTTRVLRENSAITGKAIEKWCFFRVFSLMIGQQVSRDCSKWHVYTKCREICEIIFAPTIDRSWLIRLGSLIYSFLEDFNETFPDCMTPKMHFLVHYPSQIAKFGPLRH